MINLTLLLKGGLKQIKFINLLLSLGGLVFSSSLPDSGFDYKLR